MMAFHNKDPLVCYSLCFCWHVSLCEAHYLHLSAAPVCLRCLERRAWISALQYWSIMASWHGWGYRDRLRLTQQTFTWWTAGIACCVDQSAPLRRAITLLHSFGKKGELLDFNSGCRKVTTTVENVWKSFTVWCHILNVILETQVQQKETGACMMHKGFFLLYIWTECAIYSYMSLEVLWFVCQGSISIC